MHNQTISKAFNIQGTSYKKEYFEGWYFKQVNLSHDVTISFIFGYSTNTINPHSFIQIIRTNPLKTYYISYPLEEFIPMDNGYNVGNTFFSINELKLNISNNEIQCVGQLNYDHLTELDGNNWYMPNIMGPFSYIPNMECNHGVVSMHHNVNGTLKLNNESFEFKDDTGYIEKDWGTSFPNRYIWLQGNHFTEPDTSFMLSIANIPFLGFNFEGLIASLNINNKSYRFATYTGAFKRKLLKYNDGFELIIQRGFYKLIIIVHIDEQANLVSPLNGLMMNTIKEGLGGKISLSLHHFNKLIWSDSSNSCGVEIEGY